MALWEPAIHHAVVALSSIFELFGHGVKGDRPELQFALRHYGKAIRLIAHPATAKTMWQSQDTPLLACALFGAIESMSNRFESAVAHKVSGLKILAERFLENAPSTGYGVPQELLQSTFLHFDSENLELGEPEISFAAIRSPTSSLNNIEGIRTTVEAWKTFEPLYNRILRVTKKPDHTIRTECPLMYFVGPLPRIPEMIQKYSDWSFAFDKYVQTVISTSKTLASNDQIPSILILQMRRLLVKIILHIDLQDGQMDFDRFTPEFTGLVSMAERFLEVTATPTSDDAPVSSCSSMASQPDERTSSLATPILQRGFLGIKSHNTPLVPGDVISIDQTALSTATILSNRLLSESPSIRNPHATVQPTFTISPGIIPPLHVLVTHCRDPHLRRRALKILVSCNRKEGQWDSVLCARWGRRAVEREEGAALGFWNAEGTVLSRIEHAWQVPDAVRVR